MSAHPRHFSKERLREVYWKSCSHEGYLNIYIYRKVSIRIAVLAAKLRMTPNQVTVWSLVFSLASAGMFAVNSVAIALLGLIPFHIGKILDCADGQLASLTDQKSALGAFLDPFFDRIVDIAVLLGLSVGYHLRGGSMLGFYLVLALTIALFIAAYLDKFAVAEEKSLDNLRNTTQGLPPAIRRLAKWDGGFTGLITTVALVFNAIPALVAVFVAIATITLPMQFKKIYNRLKTA